MIDVAWATIIAFVALFSGVGIGYCAGRHERGEIIGKDSKKLVLPKDLR